MRAKCPTWRTEVTHFGPEVIESPSNLLTDQIGLALPKIHLGGLRELQKFAETNSIAGTKRDTFSM